jgi:type IV secretion system protein VirB1
MILTLAAIGMLATSPECGSVEPGKLKDRVVATVMGESGGDPWAINVNGPGGGRRRFSTKAAAVAYARGLDAAGIDYDAGIAQINRRQFSRHHLTVISAFDACASIRAEVAHLEDDYQAAILHLASRRYNCGRFDCGIQYAQRIDALAQTDGQPAEPAPPHTPAPPPPLRDALHEPSSGGLTDLLAGHHPQKTAPVTHTDEKDHHEEIH